MAELKVKIIDASWHRNGVCGMGFWAIIFDEIADGKTRRMYASLFDERGYCSVVNIALLAEGNVQFGQNSFRGDIYEDKLRPAIEEFEKQGSNRLGQFSAIPPGAIEDAIQVNKKKAKKKS